MGKKFTYNLLIVKVDNIPRQFGATLDRRKLEQLIQERWPVTFNMRKYVRNSDEKPFRATLRCPASLMTRIEAIDQSKLKNDRFSSIVYLDVTALGAVSKVRTKEEFSPDILDDIQYRDQLGILFDYRTGIGVICSHGSWTSEKGRIPPIQHGLLVNGENYSHSIFRRLKVPKEVLENKGIVVNLGHICSNRTQKEG